MTDPQPNLQPDESFRAALAELVQELASMPVADTDDLATYLGLSGRLAALGDTSALARWRQRYRGEVDLAGLAEERALEGLDDLDTLDGELLGLAIVEAQDWYCAAQAEPDLRRIHESNSKAGRCLAAWFEEADGASLDDEAAEFLRTWLARYPIPDDDRLGPLVAPQGTSEVLLQIDMVEPAPVLHVTARREWSGAAIDSGAEIRLAAAGRQASPDECRRVARSAEFNLANARGCRCDIWLEEDRSLRVGIDAPRQAVLSVSVAGWPLERIAGDEGRGTSVWSASLAGFPWNERKQLTDGVVRLRFASGARVAIEG